MGRLSSPKPKLTEHSYMGSNGDIYDCPNVEAIDENLRAVLKAIKDSKRAPVRKGKLEADLDMLLALRWLMAPSKEVPI